MNDELEELKESIRETLKDAPASAHVDTLMRGMFLAFDRAYKLGQRDALEKAKQIVHDNVSTDGMIKDMNTLRASLNETKEG